MTCVSFPGIRPFLFSVDVTLLPWEMLYSRFLTLYMTSAFYRIQKAISWQQWRTVFHHWKQFTTQYHRDHNCELTILKTYPQDSVGALLLECWSFFGNHHDKHCRNVLSQNRRRQPLSSSSDTCIPRSQSHVWGTSMTKDEKHKIIVNHFNYTYSSWIHV